MQRHLVTVPASVFRLSTVDWDIDWRSQMSGEANDGNTQTVFNAFPRWVAEPQLALAGEMLRQWRAIRLRAQGQVGILRIIMTDPVGFDPAAVGVDQAWLETGVPFDTDQPFSTGQGFEFDPFVMADAAAPAGAEVIRVLVSDMTVPAVGQFLSHDDWPFVVTSVTPVSGGAYELGVQMPLRRAIPSGAAIQMRATGLFEMVNPRGGNPSYGLDFVSRPSIALREYLNRA